MSANVPFDLDRPPDWPLVSVSLLTYNQVGLIARAIEGVLAQRVNFTYELLIGDDCSDDGTGEVLRDYAGRYPDLITLTLHPRRYDEVPGRTNNVTNLMACRGKYTAMLDGDDYWTDPLKLQRQVDKLEAEPEVVACSHDSSYEHDGKLERYLRLPPTLNGKVGNPPSGYYALRDIMPNAVVLMKPSSFMFRTRVYGSLPPWFDQIVMADVIHAYLVVEQGLLWYDERPMAVQYLNNNSFTSSMLQQTSILRRRILEHTIACQRFPYLANSRPYGKVKNTQRLRLAFAYAREDNYAKMLKHLLIAFVEEPVVVGRAVARRIAKRVQSVYLAKSHGPSVTS